MWGPPPVKKANYGKGVRTHRLPLWIKNVVSAMSVICPFIG
jgi:hypothetical protein